MFAEGMSTCNISLLTAVDKGLFLETTFLKQRSSPCWRRAGGWGSSDGHTISWRGLRR